MLAGGENGAIVDLESPNDSRLLSAINYDDLEMPPTGKLPPKQIEVLTRWVKMGLVPATKILSNFKFPTRCSEGERGRFSW